MLNASRGPELRRVRRRRTPLDERRQRCRRQGDRRVLREAPV